MDQYNGSNKMVKIKGICTYTSAKNRADTGHPVPVHNIIAIFLYYCPISVGTSDVPDAMLTASHACANPHTIVQGRCLYPHFSDEKEAEDHAVSPC